MNQVLHDRQTWNTQTRTKGMMQAFFSRAREVEYAESAEVSRNRRQNENEIMLKIARDKLNYKIT